MTTHTSDEASPLLTPADVAKLFKVGPKTVDRWAREGKLGPVTHTLGGNRRYNRQYVMSLLEQPE